jgi:sulfite exporter TauE/SafE
MGYGMLFVIGLITSVHCAAMCGGISLSQCIPVLPAAAPGERPPSPEKHWNILFPSVIYNAGRVISYTAVGVLVGALGQVISVSGRFRGLVQLIAGVFMIIMGLTMLGMFQGSVGTTLHRFNLRMPRIFARKIDEQKAAGGNPLIIGLLNGFMPCGPLQAMQLYALSTGSPLAGGVSMFLFSMGTVPLMFGIGAVSSLLSSVSRGRSFAAAVTRVGAILVTVMGLTMFTYGGNLIGFPSLLDFVPIPVPGIPPGRRQIGRGTRPLRHLRESLFKSKTAYRPSIPPSAGGDIRRLRYRRASRYGGSSTPPQGVSTAVTTV